MARNGQLTPKRQRFVEAYLTSGNGTQAAIASGYSRKAAKAIASELLTFPDVQAAIQARQQEAARSAGVTLQRIIEEFAKLAFTTFDELVTWDGTHLTLKASAALTPAQAAAILELAEGESKSGRPLLKVKLYSKLAALESLLKCLQTLHLEERVQALEEALQQRRPLHVI
jgi:phage terminase small subunit